MIGEKVIVLGLAETIKQLEIKFLNSSWCFEVGIDKNGYRTFQEIKKGLQYTLMPLYETSPICGYYTKGMIINVHELPRNEHLTRRLDEIVMGVKSGIVRYRNLDDF